FNLLDMPYLFADEEHHQRVLDGRIGRELLDGLRDHRLQGLAFYSCGFRHIFNSAGRQIHGPTDLEGLKVRVMASPVMVDAINAIGASATPLPASEVFQALKTGVVDAAENNPQVFVADKYYEAGAMNLSFTRHFANQHVMVANRDWFDELGRTHPDLQRLIADVTRDIVPAYNNRWHRAVDEALETIRTEGVAVNQVEDLQPFADAVEPIYERFFLEHPTVDPSLAQRIRKAAGP
ncbi:MAG: TRAP transporter substrate-binding protein, partial [bacterium]|nr:TRAP transporter substrate-binding protein [bacterium]